MKSKLKVIHDIIKGKNSPNFNKLNRIGWILFPYLCMLKDRLVAKRKYKRDIKLGKDVIKNGMKLYYEQEKAMPVSKQRHTKRIE